MSRQLFNIILFFLPFFCYVQYTTVQEYYEFLEESKQSPKDYIFELYIDAMKERERKDFHYEFTTLRFSVISASEKWGSKVKE
ncbi:hypothetical protein [Myroides sp. C4067]|uniref:hypothetical protein n=1 Tax=Myroides sp. C4067 TaxID=3136765 RepID=UPI003100D1CA